MTNAVTLQRWLATLPPFDTLPTSVLTQICDRAQWVRYRMGQPIVTPEHLPAHVCILSEGQVRILGNNPETQQPIPLQVVKPGEGGMLGWVSLVRDRPCEFAIASTEAVAALVPATLFLDLLRQYPSLDAWVQQPTAIEVFELIGGYLQQIPNSAAILQAQGADSVRHLALQLLPRSQFRLLTAEAGSPNLDSGYRWFVSNGATAGQEIRPGDTLARTPSDNGRPIRLIGIPADGLQAATVKADLVPSSPIQDESTALHTTSPEIPYLEATSSQEIELPASGKTRRRRYPFVRGRGAIDAPLACFRMLSQHFNLPFRRDVIRNVLASQQQRTGGISLQACGAIAELMGLNAQMATIPAVAASRMQTPALCYWGEQLALVYEANPREMAIAVPERGLLYVSPTEILEAGETSLQVVVLKETQFTPKQRFDLRWFWPSIVKYRRVLFEVLIASFFVQLFALANPLMVQVIIDKVLVQGSVSTLNVLGSVLLVVALFEGFLSAIRTNLFSDTTNRIDMALGSQVIDHLLRLPLRYFERRPVGELASRVNELENIRQFLTGTALTVVLDAVFSVIYILVMILYSWLLTIIALAIVPFFGLLTLSVAPILRQQARSKAQRNAETQSYLVEAVSGIQTVKAQNIELSTRWRWQQLYAQYVNAGFKTVITSSTAGSISNFLNKLSGLLLLWAGAYLVIQGDLTLGQLIAFRIIASYVTSPLLRLLRLWQDFQETALSLERLSDILDTPQELEDDNRTNIPLPLIEGAVAYDNVSFRFGNSGPMQLICVNLDFQPGQFVAIVGQSGSGKSTLMKLLMRLYEPAEGRILIDHYDIHKVELYSLRRQIGMVLQDTLLFDGTVQENIALTNPDASVDEIVRAAKVAFAHDFIMQLPAGYNTRVGERGSALSGGQRQRVAIARTILQNPRLLIMDEATSALDYNAERQVCDNLAVACKDRTVLFITHRLGSIKRADIIVVMDKGKVAERGTHAELMNLKGLYYALYKQQESQM